MGFTLIDLRDCKPENLMWVSGYYDAAHKRPTGWHLFQFGAEWDSPWEWAQLAVQPPCRAPSFLRSNHIFWQGRDQESPTEGWLDPGGLDGDKQQFWCHKCIVEVVMKFPGIFE